MEKVYKSLDGSDHLERKGYYVYISFKGIGGVDHSARNTQHHHWFAAKTDQPDDGVPAQTHGINVNGFPDVCSGLLSFCFSLDR